MQVTALTDEQQALRDVTRDVLDTESPPSAVRVLTDGHTPVDDKLWRIGGELGWFGLESPESAGGSGQTFLETAIVLRELGRAAAPGPFLSQVITTAVLGSVPDHPISRSWLDRLCAGEARGAVVLGVLDAAGRRQLPIRAERTGGGVTLRGRQTDVPDVDLADVVLVAAAGEDGPILAAVTEPRDALGAVWQPTHDRTRRLVDVTLDGVSVSSAAILAEGPNAAALLDAAWQRGIVGLALDGAGGAAVLVERTVGYTSQRVQYGRPIATFQAVKHTCADMFVESEVARIAADAAVLEIVAGDEAGRRFWSAVAKFRACDAYAKVAGDALQMHGGIGMTWEFDLHIWLKRAKLNQALWGSSDAHRAVVTRLV